MELKRLIDTFKLFKNNFRNTEVFLFGSILSSDRFEDIDILLIYQYYEELVILKKEIQDLLPYVQNPAQSGHLFLPKADTNS